MASSSHLGFDIPVTLRLLDGKLEELDARIRRVNTGFFQVRAHVHLAIDRVVEIEYGGERIRAEVVYSQKQDIAGYHIGLRMVSGNHGTTRQELRLPVDVPAKLTIAGSDTAMPMRLVDMSQSGLGMILPAAVTTGESASIELEHGVAFGEIRYCREQPDHAYRAGFWLEEFIACDQHTDGHAEGKKWSLRNFGLRWLS